jgi:hypothetical protein
MSRENDLDIVSSVTGLFVGYLTPEELDSFNRLVAAGVARREYVGAGGFMGLAKVRLNEDSKASP